MVRATEDTAAHGRRDALPAGDFVRVWHTTFDDRMKGILKGSKACIQSVCRQLGVSVDDHLIDIAVDIELGALMPCITSPRPDSIYVLKCLKSHGCRTGLVSDCSTEVPDLWQVTLLAPLIDVTVFSCLTGTKKPDSRLFKMALDALQVKAEKSLYVADGIGRELGGAAALGIDACMLHVPGENDDDPYREKWDGPVISSLNEVLGLVGLEA